MKKNIKVFVFLVKLYSGLFHPIVSAEKNIKVFVFLVKLYSGVFHPIVSAEKNIKVFVFLVELYRGVFHPINFSLMVNFSSLWGWGGGNWSPTGHLLVVLLYFKCVGTGHVA